MTYQALAFFTGLLGSLHCVAMCGPLMLAMPLGNLSTWQLLFRSLFYQSGRILMYSFLGLLSGTIGTGFNIIGWQKSLSVGSGIILLLISLSHFFPQLFKSDHKLYLKFSSPIHKLLAKYLFKPYGSFVAGLLNGLLPCAMVYLALAGSLNAGSLAGGGIFMIYFGLGTSPMLILTSIFPLFFKRKFQAGNLTYYLFILVGTWLILRGTDWYSVLMHQNGLGIECR